MHVHEQYPQVWSVWAQRLVPGAADDAGNWWDLTRASLAVLLVAAMPWSLWIIAALVQPFSTSSAGSRGRMFLGWGWFLVVALLVLLTPDAQVLPAVLPVLPVVGVLLGQLFRQYADLSAEGRHARFWRALRWPQLGLLFAVSVAGPVVLATQAELVREGFLPRPLTTEMHPAYWIAVGAVLVTLVFFSLRFALRQYPGWALGAWALWMVLAVTALVVPVTRGDLLRPAMTFEARRLAQTVGDGPLYTLAKEPDPVVLLHLSRPVTVVQRDQLAAMRSVGNAFALLAPLRDAGEPGFLPVEDLPALGLMLWRTGTADEAAPGTMPADP
jgi:hypothetical protein